VNRLDKFLSLGQVFTLGIFFGKIQKYVATLLQKMCSFWRKWVGVLYPHLVTLVTENVFILAKMGWGTLSTSGHSATEQR
jgi:hypothetical protein